MAMFTDDVEYRLSTPLDIPSPLGNIAPRPRSIFPHLWGISPLDPTRYSPSSPLYRPSWHSVDIPPLPRNIAPRPLDILPVRHYIDRLGTRSIFLHFLGISPQPTRYSFTSGEYRLSTTRYSPSSPLYRPSWHSVDIPPLPRNIAPRPLDILPVRHYIDPLGTRPIFLHFLGISPLDPTRYSPSSPLY
ncbi:hypothetical protein CC2G_012354 [Coprinopsis cinerea AmutBmut pab1-1]|nr:hypothetical protein CC2G_012354 [Coprinopsis cinerea AmutBmut pab1-1]